MAILLMLGALASSCASVKTSSPAICDGTKRYVDKHADALLGDRVPDAVVVTGASLIAAIDAACGV